ncbi:bifunctional serine/threonine-protein kinase/ABC transporter substrate-binding protein [Streptomyces stelliscabiei]
MERLRSSDPARIAGHRLLGRLGAGGMGVVYLARTPTGSLVALKVLAAEYAEDAGFRGRFRREVEVARRIDSPWAVPLVDADADAEAPWLATAYVPGPSLAEAVTAYGPLGEHGLRILGGRLALALGEVHRAGLVHRDLKPGNVLLASDGPRLIDFGIARAPEDHSLTATGFVVGTPGYLSPEQADGRGGGTIGAPSDVFSLGCVLAFAATGRPPFGEGTLDALLFRAVHDPADLDGVPAALADLLSRCLDKDPARRPEVTDVVRELLPDGTVEGAAPGRAGDGSDAVEVGSETVEVGPDAGAGEAAAASPAHTRGGTPADAPGDAPASWLPDEVIRLIARRSTEALALPDIEHTEISADAARAGTVPDGGSPDVSAPRRSASDHDTASPASGDDDTRPTAGTDTPGAPARRRALLVGAGALLAVGGATAWWAVGREEGSGGKKPAAAPRRPAYTLALHGDLSGEQRGTGRAQERGLRLAVEEFNARRGAPFRVGVRAEDDGGDPAEAARLAKRLADDPPCWPSSARPRTRPPCPRWRPTTPPCCPSWGSPPAPSPWSCRASARICRHGCPTRCSRVPRRGPARCPSAQDRSRRRPGRRQLQLRGQQQPEQAVPYGGQPFVPRVVGTMRSGFGDTVDDLLAADIDSFAFAGLPDRAASFARTLSERGYTGARASGPALLDPRFLTQAKEAADGWTIVAPVVEPADIPRPRRSWAPTGSGGSRLRPGTRRRPTT